MRAVLSLARAHVTRRPARFVLACFGTLVAVAFAGVVLSEATISGDRAARDVLAHSSPLERTVRVTWSDPMTGAVQRQARGLLARVGLPAQSEAVLFSPIRLSGTLVQLAAVAPLGRWSSSASRLGSCDVRSCPMVLADGRLPSSTLSAAGIRITVVGPVRLSSAVPLGFAPTAGRAPSAGFDSPSGNEPPLLLSPDISGLERLGALSGFFRVHSWASTVPVDLDSWSIPALERRLQTGQAELAALGGGYSFSAPFDALAAARARAAAAPRRMLLTGGGVLAVLTVFLVLAGGAMRREQRMELARLRLAGARSSECLALSVVEAGCVTGGALLAGAAVAVGACAILAWKAALPSGATIDNALLTPATAAGIPLALLVGTAGLAAIAGSPRRLLVTVADGLGLAAVAALIVALALGTGSSTLALLLAPLACLAAGVALARGAAVALRLGGGLARRAPPLVRAAAIGLARGPGLASVAIAFTAISIGLGGFALCFRATFERHASDQAAARVPLDASVAAGADFATPLQLQPLSRWRSLAGGPVLPVHRTEASYLGGGATVTVPALGVPAGGLRLIHGWRAGDASTPLSVLARRLMPPGPARRPGPELPAGAQWLAIRAASPDLGLGVTADLRRSDGSVQQLPLGETFPHQVTLRAALPRGRFELEALQLTVPPGTEATVGHQNAENPVAQPQLETPVRLGSLTALDRQGRALAVLSTANWRGVGAAHALSTSRGGILARFAAAGSLGVLRPPQPSDARPLPVLVDPTTAAATGPGGELPLAVDGLPVRARVVGVLRRFPTLSSDAAGFVVADTSRLGAALDAGSPGQGQANELWLSAPHPARLRAALASAPLTQLSSAFRSDVERALRDDPIARGVAGMLLAGAALALVLALAGALAVASDSVAESGVRRDLAGVGLGPVALRRELRLRLGMSVLVGVVAGAAIAVLLTALAVPAVGGVLGAAAPPPVTVLPPAALALWTGAALAALVATDWIATASLT